jgi:hypothetical protein
MTIMFSDEMLTTLDDIKKFLMNPLVTEPSKDTKPYDRALWIWERLVRFKYLTLRRPEKKIVIEYCFRMTGLCAKQIGRHIAEYKGGKKPYQPTQHERTRHCFAKKYTSQDIDLLAEVDRATSVISGTLTKSFLENEWKSRACR